MPAGSDTPTATPPGPPTQGQPAPSGPPGYLTPEELAKRKALDERADQGMNMGTANAYKRQHEQDEAATAAASGGRFVMDADAMRKFLPKWQSIADKLEQARLLGTHLKALRPPAQDEGSLLQKKAADAHADAYVASVTEQRDYARAYANALKTAIEKYEQRDQATADTVRKHGVQR
ncbi:hypothetical protein [Amycolatopsis sp. NPDC059657]|uniref:hypothetical protein n=1 Tax=Amycolatopsis sp. NPDC059657 TaxID=3346899 RepID=UPI0036730327